MSISESVDIGEWRIRVKQPFRSLDLENRPVTGGDLAGLCTDCRKDAGLPAIRRGSGAAADGPRRLKPSGGRRESGRVKCEAA
jgi:hypothetical protein